MLTPKLNASSSLVAQLVKNSYNRKHQNNLQKFIYITPKKDESTILRLCQHSSMHIPLEQSTYYVPGMVLSAIPKLTH